MSSSVSFVIPCLNEEYTLPFVLEKISAVKSEALSQRVVEIIVADNGSDDRSIQIAEKFGARIVHCSTKGYGAALKGGIEQALGEIIIFADADNTYDFLETPKLIQELERGYDLVLGSRLRGTIKKHAMPFLHRYLGTPVLNFVINFLYAKGKNRINDCNSGFRCFKRESYKLWGIKGDGMEFASEMLIKAMIHDAKISQVPVTLYPDMKANRVPHLKTWRDGMRHLLQILVYAPKFFRNLGYLLFGLCWISMVLSAFIGPIVIAHISVLGLHTMMFIMLGSFLGIFSWSLGLFLSLKKNEDSLRDYDYIMNLQEDKLLVYILLLCLLGIISFTFILFQWSQNSFTFLSLEKQTLVLIAFSANNIFIVSNIIAAHLLKRL